MPPFPQKKRHKKSPGLTGAGGGGKDEEYLIAWKPGGPTGRKYLIDEISLARWQAAEISRARTKAAPIQSALLQGELPLVW